MTGTPAYDAGFAWVSAPRCGLRTSVACRAVTELPGIAVASEAVHSFDSERNALPTGRADGSEANAYGVGVGFGSSFAAQSPELKSVNNVYPFHGMAFITNGALAVKAFGS